MNLGLVQLGKSYFFEQEEVLDALLGGCPIKGILWELPYFKFCWAEVDPRWEWKGRVLMFFCSDLDDTIVPKQLQAVKYMWIHTACTAYFS